MRTAIKKIIIRLPLFAKKSVVHLYEIYFKYICLAKEQAEYKTLRNMVKKTHPKKRVLLYHISGLSFGGTEKNLQIIANNLCDDYEVFFLYSNKNIANNRLSYINKKVYCIEFDYTEKEPKYPFYIKGMNPHIKNVIAENEIDLLITADSGYTQYPINTIIEIPIVLINIFGSPTLQKNIVATLFISKTVQKSAEGYTGPRHGNTMAYIPSAQPKEGAREQAQQIRKNFNIPESDFVFGRIGRNADSIFDPIGIIAFQKIVKEFPQAHYLIMSPPPLLEKMVHDENIPNVHFLPQSSSELDIWGFHFAINCLAHFRLDGETCGLNIAESMYVGNPIISHRSHIWNAHTEYLTDSFARVAKKDDALMYASYMKEFITIKENCPEQWKEMKISAHTSAEKNFSEKVYMEKINSILHTLLKS